MARCRLSYGQPERRPSLLLPAWARAVAQQLQSPLATLSLPWLRVVAVVARIPVARVACQARSLAEAARELCRLAAEAVRAVQ